jgi:hypothetical protein
MFIRVRIIAMSRKDQGLGVQALLAVPCPFCSYLCQSVFICAQ